MAYTTIDKPTDYFETVTYAGGTTDISSLDFQPDFVWGKKRDGAENYALFDSVRGATKTINSNTTAIESTRSGSLTSFDSDGFTLGGSDGIISNSGSTYVAWSWKAGTSFTNDASSTGIGSIDSTGSVNTDAGFSIISYTGTGSAATVAHGLGVAPAMIIIKNRSTTNGWEVYHQSIGNTKYLALNVTDAALASASRWNNTSPTSTVFTVNTENGVNKSGSNLIAYCFAEKQGYSKFGSYTGNGNADGTFVYTGFKPAFVLKKNISVTRDWGINDTEREPFNANDNILRPNLNNAEQSNSAYAMDFLSNGFKLRGTDAEINTSGNTYIYMAFAENPFVTSTGVCATAR